jgi:DNA-binding CsgD family transcriptional regulator
LSEVSATSLPARLAVTAELTSREMQVLALMADGLRNALPN